MKKINSIADLNESILLLEAKELESREVLLTELKRTIENFSPTEFMRDKMVDLVKGGEIKSVLLNVGATLATDYISSKLTHSKKASPLKNVMGVLLKMGVQRLLLKQRQKLQKKVVDRPLTLD